jgi:hypothetical protein
LSLSRILDKLKDGSRGKLRIDYGDPKQPEKAIAWLWKFMDGAKTAGDLYGRALVVIAAEQYACRLALPSSQRFGAKRWPSHKDHAAKALQKLAGPHMPATLKHLEKAIAKANSDLSGAQEKARSEKPKASASAVADAEKSPVPDDVGPGGLSSESSEIDDLGSEGDGDGDDVDDSVKNGRHAAPDTGHER